MAFVSSGEADENEYRLNVEYGVSVKGIFIIGP
ncbi:predicted protein [Sclerotinia sclerotiorum 1980 UF-70]|uniref:Uncharacterized protein n=1 Tax=Sclerotinia sclerotiorum (strain ATCC 18683 / 1980 / Ss-1) TaxID=665079 RepID=A7EBX3_SCLS1|nr:predicted protein [Sclerotinia sclerotiorum 1980 UF-70]EDN99951.1 predicted protein [Sclerotinia sclerotiorum 1980 UF-70]